MDELIAPSKRYLSAHKDTGTKPGNPEHELYADGRTHNDQP